MNEPAPKNSAARIVVGVSSCLLGNCVRHDGGHKANSTIIETLGQQFEFHAFCPELEIGLGVPRRAIQLRRLGSNMIRCVTVDDIAIDHSDALLDCADNQLKWQEGLSGYILKAGSPSCGMEGVAVWDGHDSVQSTICDGDGIYAARLMQNLPDLPVEEEGRLEDPSLRDRFVRRVQARHRWLEMHKFKEP